MTKPEKWIQQAVDPHKKGTLHRQLGIPQSKTIPKKTLQAVVKTEIGKSSHGVTVTPLLKKRNQFALNVQKRK